jgi:hypothetical protein
MLRGRTAVPAFAIVAALILAGCTQDVVTPPGASPRDLRPSLNTSGAEATSSAANALVAIMDAINVSLEAEGADYRVAVADYVTSADGGEPGGTVIAKDVGNKQLPHDFVPFDARRAGWSGPVTGSNDNITYAIDRSVNASGTRDAVPPVGGLTAAQTDAAIVRAMMTWENVNCSALGLTRNNDFGLDIGVVAFQTPSRPGGPPLGGSPFVFADVQHAGWRDINFAGGILGVTFTFVFIQPNPNPPPAFVPTDIDGNGKADVAFREIYYDPSFSWADNGVANVDVQTVALHEAGHGLSQAHFGTLRIKNDGSFKASPRAVMNAAYSGVFRGLAGTDNGGHCSNWADWPNN